MQEIAQELPKWFLLGVFIIVVFIIGIVINTFLQEWVKTKFKNAKKGTRFEDRGEKPWVDRFIESQDRAADVTSNQITMLASLNKSQQELVEAQKGLAKMLKDRTPTLIEMYDTLTLYDEDSQVYKYLLKKIQEKELKESHE